MVHLHIARPAILPNAEMDKMPLGARIAIIFALACCAWMALIALPAALIFAPDAVFSIISKFVSVGAR